MAEAYLNKLYGDRYEAFSAGTKPTLINQYVVKIMSEEGFDLSAAQSKSVDEFMNREFNIVVTVCDNAREACPFFPGDELIHHSFRDPSSFTGSEDEVLEIVREIRDEIREWVTEKFRE